MVQGAGARLSGANERRAAPLYEGTARQELSFLLTEHEPRFVRVLLISAEWVRKQRGSFLDADFLQLSSFGRQRNESPVAGGNLPSKKLPAASRRPTHVRDRAREPSGPSAEPPRRPLLRWRSGACRS